VGERKSVGNRRKTEHREELQKAKQQGKNGIRREADIRNVDAPDVKGLRGGREGEKGGEEVKKRANEREHPGTGGEDTKRGTEEKGAQWTRAGEDTPVKGGANEKLLLVKNL